MAFLVERTEEDELDRAPTAQSLVALAVELVAEGVGEMEAVSTLIVTAGRSRMSLLCAHLRAEQLADHLPDDEQAKLVVAWLEQAVRWHSRLLSA